MRCRACRPRIRRHRVCATIRSADVGLDVRYGITQNISADITYNTDFAQVEADEQQVNPTRFNLFFPEKREFSLRTRACSASAASPPTRQATRR